MNDQQTATGNPLDQIIADYIQSVEAGKVPSREDLLAEFPQFADGLREFFADFDRMDNRADAFKLTTKPPAARPTVKYFGNYELLEEIAEGGMGLVYKARQLELGRIVALKLIRAGQLAKPIDVARFRIEAEAAAALDHPNIVPLYEVGDHEGQQFLAMKYIDGPPLARYPRGDIRTEVAMMEQVCRAVHHAHQQGILHRDIKPGNILVQATNQTQISQIIADTKSNALNLRKSAQSAFNSSIPYVTDFGLAKRLDADKSLTETGAQLGTAGYMSPEQALGKKGLTFATDVFSLGAILYERFTGKMAFPGTTLLERIRALDNAPSRPTTLMPTLHRDLETVCLKCLEREPQKRYESAGDLADDLSRWLRGEPIVARPVSSMERFWLWCRRNPAIAGWAGATTVALVVGIVISTFFAMEAKHQAASALNARDDAERQLMRTVFRPLGFDTGPLTAAEYDSLEELAQFDNDRRIEIFFDEVFATPSSALRFARRCRWITHAVVGLNESRRRAVLAIASQKQRDTRLSPESRLAACCLAMQLGDVDLPAAGWDKLWAQADFIHGLWLNDLTRQQTLELLPHWIRLLDTSTDSLTLQCARAGIRRFADLNGTQLSVDLSSRATLLLQVKDQDELREPWHLESATRPVKQVSKLPLSSHRVNELCAAIELATDDDTCVRDGLALAELVTEPLNALDGLVTQPLNRYWRERHHRILSVLMRVLRNKATIDITESSASLAIATLTQRVEPSMACDFRKSAATAITETLESAKPDKITTRLLAIATICRDASKEERDAIMIAAILSASRWDDLGFLEDKTIAPYVSWGLSRIDSVTTVLADPKCVGEIRDAAIHRLEELAFPPTAAEQQQAVATSVVSGLTEPLAAGLVAVGRQAQWEKQRKFRTIWDAVAWLKKNHPEIDLDAPYKPRR